MGKMIPEKESGDPAEAVKALESGIKILARMIVKAIMKELSTQEKIPADTINNLIMSTSRTSLSEQRGKSFAFSPREVAKLLGVSKNTVYDAVRTGQIPSVRFGKRILIPRVALVKKLEEAGIAKIDKGQH